MIDGVRMEDVASSPGREASVFSDGTMVGVWADGHGEHLAGEAVRSPVARSLPGR
jgi:hypothetical protein